MSRNCAVPTLNSCHAGDVNDRRIVILNGVDSLLSFSSGIANIQRNGVSADLVVSVVDPVKRIVQINLGVAPTDWLPSRPALGTWIGQLEITFGDGTILTWPSRAGGPGIFEITVLRELT